MSHDVNGDSTAISADGSHTSTIHPNKTKTETDFAPDGSSKAVTTNAAGEVLSETTIDADGVTTVRTPGPDGSTTYTNDDGSSTTLNPDGSSISRAPDGQVMSHDVNGDSTAISADGSHTSTIHPNETKTETDSPLTVRRKRSPRTLPAKS